MAKYGEGRDMTASSRTGDAPASVRRRLGGSAWTPAVDSVTVVTGPTTPDPTPATASRHHHRRRPWFRRPLIMLPLVVLLIVGSVGGYLLLQAGSTVSTIHDISTPPAVISGDALGEDTDVQIDTSAAVDSVTRDPRFTREGNADRLDGAWEIAGGLTGGVSAAAGTQETPDQPLNILLMGVDARPGEAIDVGVRPDALSVLHLDPATGSCRLLAIPRDSRVELPGYGQSKINHALAVGGIPYQMQVVEQFLGIRLYHFGLIYFGGLEQFVDAVGGVTITVPETFSHLGVTFEAGTQTLNGEEALIYARYRYGPDGDFGRIGRQQQVLRALIAELSGIGVTQAVNDLVPALKDHTRTDLTIVELVALANQYQGRCTEDSIETDRLNGTVGTFYDPLIKLDLSYVIVDEAEVREKVTWLTGEEPARTAGPPSHARRQLTFNAADGALNPLLGYPRLPIPTRFWL